MLKARDLQPRLEALQVGDNSLQLFRDGHELFTVALAAIDDARECIFLEASNWKDDEAASALKHHLLHKALQGVEVYVMGRAFDRQNVLRTVTTFPNGLHLLRSMPFRRLWDVLDPRCYAQDHRQLLVVDGLIGFIGGHHLEHANRDASFDTYLCVRGPATADLAYSFVTHWNRFSPPREQIARRYTRTFNPWITIQANDALRLTFPIRDRYIEAIDRAERTILLTNTSFVPDHSLLEALTGAVTRGVHVGVLVPWPSGRIFKDQVMSSSFTRCLQAGIHLYLSRQRGLRSKTCTIDGQWSTIGSAHLDFLSSVVNYELNIEVYDVAFASQMQELFYSDIADARELSLARWLNRPLFWKLTERTLTPFRLVL